MLAGAAAARTHLQAHGGLRLDGRAGAQRGGHAAHAVPQPRQATAAAAALGPPAACVDARSAPPVRRVKLCCLVWLLRGLLGVAATGP